MFIYKIFFVLSANSVVIKNLSANLRHYQFFNAFALVASNVLERLRSFREVFATRFQASCDENYEHLLGCQIYHIGGEHYNVELTRFIYLSN